MKILVAGGTGLLGSHLVKVMTRKGHDVVAPKHGDEFDMLKRDTVIATLTRNRPDVVINCVGLANVDACEADPNRAYLVNAESVLAMAHLTRIMGIRLIHISTDHLFDGRYGHYSEQAIPDPVNVYGWSKVCGEMTCLNENPSALVVRTNFYGFAPEGHPPTFADWLYTSLRDKKPLQLFDDYYFSALEVHYLAEALENILHHRLVTGILNIVSCERVSKAEFGKAMAKVFGFSLDAVSTRQSWDVPMRVKRPMDLSLSVVRVEKILGYKPAGLYDGLQRLENELSGTWEKEHGTR
jgi:dTDP-4-dehydrorhamnose reductase